MGNCLFVILPLSVVCLSVEYTGQREHGVCRIITLLPVLCMFWFTFLLCQRLWLFVTTLLIFCCLICHQAVQLVEFLKLAASSTCTSALQVSLLIWFASSDFSFLGSFLFTSGHCSRMEYWMLLHFHPFFSALQFFIFCIVHVQPFFCSFDVETSFCLCGKWCSWARS